jgi:hypothetical protein
VSLIICECTETSTAITIGICMRVLGMRDEMLEQSQLNTQLHVCSYSNGPTLSEITH